MPRAPKPRRVASSADDDAGDDDATGAAPARYRLILDQLLRSQAHREMGAALLYENGAPLVPDRRLRKVYLAHAREEREHYGAVATLWSRLARAPRAELDDWVARRLETTPLPTAASWFELAMAQFLFDRAGRWQLGEYRRCCFVPYRQLVARILKDEQGHQDLGAKVVVSLCRAGDHQATKNQIFARWLRPALFSFGRPGGPGNRDAIAFGIKRRDSGAVMADFVADIKPTVRAAGLLFPPPESLGVDLPSELYQSMTSVSIRV